MPLYHIRQEVTLGRDPTCITMGERIEERRKRLLKEVQDKLDKERPQAMSPAPTSTMNEITKEKKALYDAWRILEAIRKGNFTMPYGGVEKITDWLSKNQQQYQAKSKTELVLKWTCCICDADMSATKSESQAVTTRWWNTTGNVLCKGCGTSYKTNWGKVVDGEYVAHPTPFVELQ